MTPKDPKKTSNSSLNQFLSKEQKIESDLEDQSTPKTSDQVDLLEHPSYIELQNRLTDAEEKATQYWERMLRMQAETENIQRRVQRDVENAHKFGLEKFVLELLPVIDNLERAVMLPEEHKNNALEGVELTLKMLYGALAKFGIEQIDPLSQPFNPELHQAVSTQVDESVPPNTVLTVLQKGYSLNNRLIRPAFVTVSKIG